MAHHIETEALTKFYGRQRGVEELNLRVGPGEVFGFLGPNGAGKTTTIRLLMDLIRRLTHEATGSRKPPPRNRAASGRNPRGEQEPRLRSERSWTFGTSGRVPWVRA